MNIKADDVMESRKELLL